MASFSSADWTKFLLAALSVTMFTVSPSAPTHAFRLSLPHQPLPKLRTLGLPSARGLGIPSARGFGTPSARGFGTPSARGFGTPSTRGFGTPNSIPYGNSTQRMLNSSNAQPNSAGNFGFNHPRQAEVDGRFAQVNSRISSSYGDLGGQYGKLQGRSNQIQSQMRSDVAANGGYLTKAEEGQFNREYSALGQKVSADQALGAPSGQFMQNHPRQAQVLNSAAGMNQTLSNDYGNLGGHYSGLEQRDNAIRATDRRDAQANGGYLTQQQQQQLDNREANLQNSINQDSGQ